MSVIVPLFPHGSTIGVESIPAEMGEEDMNARPGKLKPDNPVSAVASTGPVKATPIPLISHFQARG